MDNKLSRTFRRLTASRVLGTALLGGVATHAAGAAGVSSTLVPAGPQGGAIEVLVWTPCASAASRLRMGPYVVEATRDCAIAGRLLPLVVISHGQGGTRLGHHDTATALAEAGFVVASFNHAGDSFGDDAATNTVGIFASRPAQASRVITHMLGQWTHRDVIEPQSIGVFGFSRGGYTALALAGAVPSAAASKERLCGFWRSLVTPLCRQIGGSGAELKAQGDPRVRAVVAADPLNLFDAASFRSVQVPVQLWASELGGAGVELAHVELIRAALPRAPEFAVAGGAGHFAYLAPCSDEFRKEAPPLCDDPKGFDRRQWHAQMNRAVVAFFSRTLRPGPK